MSDLATTSAPTSAPVPMAIVIQLYTSAFPPNVTLASSGSTTGELMANVPTIEREQERRTQLGRLPDVAQAVADLALLAPERRVAVQLAGRASSAARR